jgi:hypothetical protein
LFPPNISTSEILIYFTLRAHLVQLSPTNTVARGRSRKVHVTFSDVIGSHHVHFYFRELGFREFVHPHTSPFSIVEIAKLRFTLRLIQRSIFLPPIYSVDRFGTSEFWASGVCASAHLILPFAEILKLWSTHLLDPTVKLLS